MNTPLIYGIVHRASGDAYVGCTTDIRTRWNQHHHYLKRRKHHSPKLQELWDTYGAAAFDLIILATPQEEKASACEILWIKKIGRLNSTNIDPEGGNQLSRSPEHRQKMRVATSERWADPKTRKALAAGLEKARATPGRVDAVRASRQRDDVKAKVSESLRQMWADPIRSAAIRNRPNNRWADPEARARHSAIMKAENAKRRAAKAKP